MTTRRSYYLGKYKDENAYTIRAGNNPNEPSGGYVIVKDYYDRTVFESWGLLLPDYSEEYLKISLQEIRTFLEKLGRLTPMK